MSDSAIITGIVIPVLAAILGAIIGAVIAFRYQATLELKRDKRAIIQNLMMYRNVAALELDWIKALNVIDVVFHRDAKVRELYHTLLVQLAPPLFENGQWRETYYQLIFEMAKCTEYRDLTKQDIRDIYYPNILNAHYAHLNAKPEPPNVSSNDSPQTNS